MLENWRITHYYSFYFQLTVNQTSHTILPDLPPSPIESIQLVKIFFPCNIVKTLYDSILSACNDHDSSWRSFWSIFFQMKMHGAIFPTLHWKKQAYSKLNKTILQQNGFSTRFSLPSLSIKNFFFQIVNLIFASFDSQSYKHKSKDIKAKHFLMH